MDIEGINKYIKGYCLIMINWKKNKMFYEIIDFNVESKDILFLFIIVSR